MSMCMLNLQLKMCYISVKSIGWATKIIPGQIVNNEKKHWGKLRVLGNNSCGMFIACPVKLVRCFCYLTNEENLRGFLPEILKSSTGFLIEFICTLQCFYTIQGPVYNFELHCFCEESLSSDKDISILYNQIEFRQTDSRQIRSTWKSLRLLNSRNIWKSLA